MPSTYEPISTTNPSGVAQVTFSSIPSTYTDIVCILSLNPSGADNMAIRFNNDSGTNYSLIRLSGNGTTASAGASTNSSYPVVMAGTYDGGVPAFFKFDIFSYSGSTYKTLLSSASVDKNGSGTQANCSVTWRSTSAINRIDLFGSFGNGTTVTLYGIKAA